jgi:hypothetical protein
MTHAELVTIAAAYARRRLRGKVVLVEPRVASVPMVPDVLSFDGWCSTMIEVKTTRADFRGDCEKRHRGMRRAGHDLLDDDLGDYRFYLAPRGVIPLALMPDRLWGLIEVDDRGRPMMIRNAYAHSNRSRFANLYESRILAAAMYRSETGKPIGASRVPQVRLRLATL